METKDFIVEKNGKQFADVVKLLPDALPSGKRILWTKVDEEKIEISVDKHSARGGNAKSTIIKRFIEINTDLFLLLGLWFGDGNRLRDGEWRAFGFSNTCLDIHKLFLILADDCLSIGRREFFCVISMPSEFKNMMFNIQNVVSQKLDIRKESFWNTTINESRNFVHIDTRINSTLLSRTMKILNDNLKQTILENEKFCISMLQGIIASEGNIHVRSDFGRLGEILIAAEGEDKREFIRNMLIKIGIQPSKDKTIEHQESVLIHGLSNFRKVKELSLVIIHPTKHRDLEIGLQGFTKEEFKKGEGKLLILQSLEKGPKRAVELSKELDRTQKAINWTMNKLQKRDLVDCFRNSKNIFWKLTDTGISLLKNDVSFEELKSNKFILP